MSDIALMLVLSVVADVIAHYICAWLDSRKTDSNGHEE